MDLVAKIERLIGPPLESMGYDLVRAKLSGHGARATLQVMVERRNRGGLTLDDCAAISRDISALLDVEDPIAGAYTLEVSSPGIERPLVRREDYDRFSGFEAKLETHRPVDGRKRFRGRLSGLAGDCVRIECDGAEARVPLHDIARAKLVLTDELIAAAMNRQDG